MRKVIEGRLYDTDISTLLHRDESMGGGYAQELYETPNGNYFYVNIFGHGGAEMHSFESPTDVMASWAKRRGFEDYTGDGAAQIWLEQHGGVDVILERWPHRIQAG